MKICRFSLRWFFIDNLFDGDAKVKMTPSRLPRRAVLEHVIFNLEMSISKFDLRSGQVKVSS